MKMWGNIKFPTRTWVGDECPSMEQMAADLRQENLTPTWKPGDKVWYSPSLNGPEFEAVVDSLPWQLGGHTWCVRLVGLPQAYCDHTCRQRFSVPAAECVVHVRRRD